MKKLVFAVCFCVLGIMGVNAETWRNIGNQKTVNDLYAVTYGGGKYYAGGEAGALLISDDGIDWRLIDSGTRKSIRSITDAFGKIIYVATWSDIFGFTTLDHGSDIGSIESGGDSFLGFSDVEIHFKTVSSFSFSGDILFGYGEEDRVFAGTAYHKLTTTDGENWAVDRNVSPSFGQHVYFDGSFYAIRTPSVYKSDDSINWVKVATLDISGDFDSKFLVVEDRLVVLTENDGLFVSLDGENWTQSDENPGFSISSVAEKDGVLVVVGPSGQISISQDLTQWLDVSPDWASSDWNSVSAGDRGFVAVGDHGAIGFSTNGADWQKISYSTPYHLVHANNHVKVIDKDGHFQSLNATENPPTVTFPFEPSAIYFQDGKIVMGSSNGEIASSNDGENWQYSPILLDSPILKFLYIEDRYVAITDSGAILESVDAFTWIQLAKFDQLLDIAYSDDYFYALQPSNGNKNRRNIHRSPDLTAWHTATYAHYNQNTSTFSGIAAGNGIVVAVTSSRPVSTKGHLAYPSVYYSVDGGLTFDYVEAPRRHHVRLHGVFFDGERFVIYGDGGVLQTSVDGKNWESEPLLTVQDYVKGFANELGAMLLTDEGQVLAQWDPDKVSREEVFNPIARVDEYTINSGDFIYMEILTNDSDIDGSIDPSSVEILKYPAGGRLIINPEGAVQVGPVVTLVPRGVAVYEHNGLLSGFDSFTYRVADNAGLFSDPVTVRINIRESIPEVIHNPVTALTIDSSLADWVDIEPAGMDARDAGAADDKFDWRNVYLAHNTDFLFIAYDSYLPMEWEDSWAHNIFIDTDEDGDTGFQYGGLGVDVLIQQGKAFRYQGSGTSWEWLHLFDIIQSGTPSLIEMAIPRLVIGTRDQISILFYGANAAYGADSTLDIFPENGQFLQYNMDVPGVNHVPVAYPKTHSGLENENLEIALSADDHEGGPLEFILITAPVNGQISGNFPNLIYTPNDGFKGVDVMTWKVNDGVHDSIEVIEEFLIYPVPDDGYFSFPLLVMNVDGELSDWSGIPPLGIDPDDVRPESSTLIDWHKVWLANTPHHLVLAVETFEANPVTSDFNIYLDTDENSDSGYLGHVNTKRINGADYLLQGRFLFRYTGSGRDWSWEYVTPVVHGWNEKVHEWKVSRQSLGNPDSVKVLLKAEINLFYQEQIPVITVTAVNDFFPDGSWDNPVSFAYKMSDFAIQTTLGANSNPVDIRSKRSFDIFMYLGQPEAIAPNSFSQPSSPLKMNVQSAAGVDWVIEKSLDLENWDSVSQMKLESYESSVVVPNADGNEAIFLRAVPSTQTNQ